VLCAVLPFSSNYCNCGVWSWYSDFQLVVFVTCSDITGVRLTKITCDSSDYTVGVRFPDLQCHARKEKHMCQCRHVENRWFLMEDGRFGETSDSIILIQSMTFRKSRIWYPNRHRIRVWEECLQRGWGEIRQDYSSDLPAKFLNPGSELDELKYRSQGEWDIDGKDEHTKLNNFKIGVILQSVHELARIASAPKIVGIPGQFVNLRNLHPL